MKVFVHGAAATPNLILDALCRHGKQSHLKNVQLFHIHTEGPALYNKPEFEGKLALYKKLFINVNWKVCVY